MEDRQRTGGVAAGRAGDEGVVGVAGLGFATRLALFFTALFLVTGTKVPYLPVWLDWRGLSAGEIATVTAAPLIIRIVATPLVAFVADRMGDHRGMLVLLAWVSLALLGGLAWAPGFAAILLVSVLLGLASSAMMPLVETVAMGGVRRAGLDYGRMRLWGSISFIAAGFAAGVLVERSGAGAVLWALAAGSAATALAAHLLPRPAPNEAVGGGRATIGLGDVAALVRARWFVLFLVAVGAIQAAHAVFYTFGVLHWHAQGLSTVTASGLWAVGVVTEIALFAVSGAAVRRCGALGLIAAGGLAAAVRWLAMAFDPPLAVLIPLQALHGLTYGATHLGAVHLMGARVPPARAGTAQALYASVTAGIAMALATLVAGRLYPAAGGMAYLAMAGLSLVGLAAVWALARAPDEATTGG